MSKFTIKTVRDGHTFISTADAVEVFENGENVGYPHPMVDIFENGKVRERINMDFLGTCYIENLSGKTVKAVHGMSRGPSAGNTSGVNLTPDLK